jgi:3,4-dihydroxy 2-butanone 4-phosphate synthase
MPFLQDVFEAAAPKFPVLADARVNDLRYDTRSSFSLPINHRGTFTGITDDDRSLTIREFGKLAKESADLSPTEGRAAFGKRFRTPGHVHVCVGAPNLLAERQGHTELAIALAREVGIPPVLVGAEMLGEGKALKPTEARSYAAKRGTVFLEGASIIEAYGARGRKETQAQGGSAAAAARAVTIP